MRKDEKCTGLTEKLCDVCKKIFYMPGTGWGWAARDEGKAKYYCTYSCMRADEEAINRKEKLKKIKKQADNLRVRIEGLEKELKDMQQGNMDPQRKKYIKHELKKAKEKQSEVLEDYKNARI